MSDDEVTAGADEDILDDAAGEVSSAGDDGTAAGVDVDAADADGEEPAPRDAADQARRIDRLRRSLLLAEPADLKRAVLALPAPSIDALAKAARARVPVLRAGSTKSLRRVDDPVLLDLLAGIVADDCLEAIRARLGDEADDPSPEALAAVVDEVTEHEFPAGTVRLTLAMVAAGLAEAADLCDRLLEADARFELPEEAEPAPLPTVAARAGSQASEEKRAARRARQAEEAERKRARQAQAAAAAERTKANRKKAAADAGSTVATEADREAEGSAVVATKVSRRRPTLVGDEAGRFNPDDPLVGAVVIAEIVFDADDAAQPDVGAKRRPCVVIGASPSQLLVRPGYSEGGVRSRDWTSHEVRDWHAAGLDKPSWIETEHRRIDRAQADEPLGRLSDHDWNALW